MLPGRWRGEAVDKPEDGTAKLLVDIKLTISADGRLEGVALEMRLNVDILEQAGLDIREFRAIGGGARSTVLTQLIHAFCRS